MVDIYEAIYLRRSIRDFKEKEIDLELIKKIIDVGLQAPTNNHMRQWEFIIINDKTSRLKVIDKITKNTTKEESVKIVDKWRLTDPLQRENRPIYLL